VDTPGACAHAEHLLFEACRKPVDGIVARNINRNISLFLSRRLKDVPISPNAVSVFNMVLGLLAAWAATHPSYVWFLVAALLLKLNSVLDGVDGELARVRLQESRLGQWLDTLADDGSNLLFFVGLSIGAAQLPGGTHFAVAGAIAALAQVSMSFLLYRELLANGTGDLCSITHEFDEVPGESLTSRVLSAVRQFVKQDFAIFFFLVMAVFGLLPWVLYFAAVGTVSALAATMVRSARLRAAGRERLAA